MKTLFTNGRIWLKKNYYAGALGMDSNTGKISFIGSHHDALNKKNEYDEFIDLEGKTVLPAFNDNHLHLVKGALVSSELNLRNITTAQEFKNEILKYRSLLKPGKWIQGGYFSDSNFTEKFTIDKNFLDEICSDVPMFISRFDIHSCFVNSRALEFINTFESYSFNDDELIKDAEGKLTGELKERPMYLLQSMIPQKSLEEKALDVKKQIKELHSLGITSVSDITLPEDLDIYEFILNEGELNLNINSILPFEEFYNIDIHKKRFESFNEIKFNCFKAFYDGSLSSRTAYYHKNYKNTNSRGIRTEYINSGDFHKTALNIDKAGYQMAVHAIGDLSVTELLNMNAELDLINGVRNRKFRIEHAQHIQPADFMRFDIYKILASVQPSHLFSDASTSKSLRSDFETTHNYPELLKYNVRLCFGTDFPIVSPSPFETIYYAVTRKAKGFENGFLPRHKMNIEDCIDAYTINNAYGTNEDEISGSLREGKRADVIVLNENIFESPEENIRSIKVEMTYKNGKRVY
ncbi:MAG: amidohydrolase [Bacteroidetes bacterium]|nr:amidohydrolase [Bacteroidota bacterium]